MQPRRPLPHQRSGKHKGFLTLARDMGATLDCLAPAHPVQRQIHAAIEALCDEPTAATVVDVCSVPNHAVSLAALARAMACYARPEAALAGRRAAAARRLTEAMIAQPILIGGPEQTATRPTRAIAGRGAAKSGADGVFVAILPQADLGITLKIDDGAAAEALIARLLVRAGVLDAAHPVQSALAACPLLTSRGAVCGEIRPVLAPAQAQPSGSLARIRRYSRQMT
ncbi:MAG: asparaginase [Pseudomonadota bacterium]